MSSDVSGINNYAYETLAGQRAVVAALVIALQESGVLAPGRYRDALHRLWTEMPDDEAEGEAGAVIEQMLDLLAAPACMPYPSNDAGRKQEFSVFDRAPVNDDAIAPPAPLAPTPPVPLPTPLNALFHALRGAGSRSKKKDRRGRFSLSDSDLS